MVGGFAGDNDGDGLMDFAASQAVFAGTPTGVDPKQYLFIQAGEIVFESAGDVDGDGYADVVSSIDTIPASPSASGSTSAQPTACGTNNCRAFSPLVVAGRDVSGRQPARDHRRGRRHQRRRRRRHRRGHAGERAVYVYLAGGARELPLSFPVRPSPAPEFGSGLAALFGTAPASP